MDFLRNRTLCVLLLLIIYYPTFSMAAEVQLGWDANIETDLAGYRIYYGTSPGAYSTSITVGTQTTYTVTGLQSGTWYFAVTAFDSSGAESGYSNEAVKTIDATPPVISSVQAINVLSSGATVTWNTDEASDSQVEYGLSTSYGTLTQVNVTQVTAHSQALPGLSADTLYHYRVRSKDAAGNEAVSPDFTFRTSPSSDSIPPVISAIGTSAIDSSSALVSWTTNEISDSQLDYGLTATYGQWTDIDPTGVTAHSQPLTGLTSGTSYHFRVKSRDSAGNLSVSGDNTFTTAGPSAIIPAYVQSNSFRVTSGNSVGASFPAANTAGNLIVVYVVWDNSGPVSLSDTNGNSYVSAVGPTKYSGAPVNAQIFYAKNISAGTNTVRAVFSTAISVSGILYIHEYSGIDALSPLESATAGTGSSAIMNSGTLNLASQNALLFVGGESNVSVTLGTYRYTVRSNQYGNLTEDWIAAKPGAFSAEATQSGDAWVMQLAAFKAATATATDTTAPQITSVSGTGLSASEASLSWTTNEASDSQAEYGLTTAYGTSTPVDSTMVTGHTIVLSGLLPGTTYHFRVKSRDAAGNMAVSPDSVFSTASAAISVPKFVQEKEAAVSSGNRVSVRFRNANTAGNLIVVYVVWDNSGPVTIADRMGNTYISAIGPSRYAGNSTSAQIFYARNISGGINTVTANFSTSVTRLGILYVHEYSGLDKAAPFESATAATGSSSLMNSGSLGTISPNALLFAGCESSGTVTPAADGYTLRSKRYGNLTEDKIAAQPGGYSAAATQNSNAWILQLVAFKPAVQQTVQTTMALPMARPVAQNESQLTAQSYLGLAVVNSGTVSASLTFTAMDSTGKELRGRGVSNPTVRTLNPGEQLRIVDRQLFGNGIADIKSEGWIKVESTSPRIGGRYAVFNEEMSLYRGAEIPGELLQTVIIPDVGTGRSKFTAVNPNPEAETVSFDIVGKDGTVRSSIGRTIEPGGSFTADSLAGVFGILPEKTDYLRVRASTGLSAFGLAETQLGDVALSSGSDQGSAAHALYAAGHTFDSGTDSTLTVVNLDSKEGFVTVTSRAADGHQVGSTNIPIAANGKIQIDDPRYLSVLDSGGGYVEVRSDDIRLAGAMALSDPGRQASASIVPLIPLQNSVLLGNMAQDELFSTTIALLNPGDNDASAIIELYSSDGSLLGSAADTIPPRQLGSRSIREYFPGIAGISWTSGYIYIRTDIPIACFSDMQNPTGFLR